MSNKGVLRPSTTMSHGISSPPLETLNLCIVYGATGSPNRMIPFSIISCIFCFTLLKGGIHGEEISFPGSLFFEGLLLGVQLDRLSNLTVSIPFF